MLSLEATRRSPRPPKHDDNWSTNSRQSNCPFWQRSGKKTYPRLHSSNHPLGSHKYIRTQHWMHQMWPFFLKVVSHTLNHICSYQMSSLGKSFYLCCGTTLSLISRGIFTETTNTAKPTNGRQNGRTLVLPRERKICPSTTRAHTVSLIRSLLLDTISVSLRCFLQCGEKVCTELNGHGFSKHNSTCSIEKIWYAIIVKTHLDTWKVGTVNREIFMLEKFLC